jgi:methylated-DNA-[protein]-cysteine S-methyltransferase
MSYVCQSMDSAVGRLKLVAKESRLCAVLWEADRPDRVRLGTMQEDENSAILLETKRQLAEYFSGDRDAFELDLDFDGTAFQTKVWEALRQIPYGETRSYGQIATQIGHPTAIRAVGAANGRNPLSIITPCHRVVGANGDLTGFAGGLAAKRLLLALEQSRTLKAAA